MKNKTLFERFGDSMPPGYAITEEQRAEDTSIARYFGNIALTRLVESGDDEYSQDPSVYA